MSAFCLQEGQAGVPSQSRDSTSDHASQEAAVLHALQAVLLHGCQSSQHLYEAGYDSPALSLTWARAQATALRKCSWHHMPSRRQSCRSGWWVVGLIEQLVVCTLPSSAHFLQPTIHMNVRKHECYEVQAHGAGCTAKRMPCH